MMDWYGIVVTIVAVLIAIYIVISAIASTKFLKHICEGKGRTWEVSRQLMIEQDKWDFNDFDNVWHKEHFELVTFDNLKLYCLNIVNPNATTINGRNKVAIVCHGHISNLMQSVKYANIFYNKGYNVILFDNRFFGKSEGYCCTLGQNETLDLASMIDKAKELYGENCYIALHGESMAGAMVLNVLQYKEQDIAMVVADCPFMDTRVLFKENAHQKAHLPAFPMVEFAELTAKYKYYYDFDNVRPIAVVEKVNTPICFIHGTADKLIYPHHSKDMFKKVKNPMSELHLFEGAVHARSHMKDREKYIEVVGNFIQKIESQDSTESNNTEKIG